MSTVYHKRVRSLVTFVLITLLISAGLPTTPHGSIGTVPVAHAADPATTTFTGSVVVDDRVVFEPTGSMAENRFDHTATLLNDGRVLVAGGNKGAYAFKTAELYDPTTGTWSTTGSMAKARYGHTATLLSNGKVLVTGNAVGAELYDPTTGTWSTTGSMTENFYYSTATLLSDGRVLLVTYGGGNRLYDPSTGTFTTTGITNLTRYDHTATLLSNGKVLVTGGRATIDVITTSSSEIYDPATGIFTPANNMAQGRHDHTATVLPDGNVLVTGGAYAEDYNSPFSYLNSAELYNPLTGTWKSIDSMVQSYYNHTAVLLPNGKVLVLGRPLLDGIQYSYNIELYDPTTDAWEIKGTTKNYRTNHTTTLLPDGKVLVAGGGAIEQSELGTYYPANILTGTLTLPTGWLTSQQVPVQFVGNTATTALVSATLSTDVITWSSSISATNTVSTTWSSSISATNTVSTTWSSSISATNGVTVSTTWNVGQDGANVPIALQLRDKKGQYASVVTGTVKVDTVPPTTTMTALPTTSPAAIPLAWSGSDSTSGIASYDVQVREGSDGAWTTVLSETTQTSTTYQGTVGRTYAFRVRANDKAGNIEAWPTTYDAQTVVDVFAPTGTVTINGGADYATSTQATLTLSASDVGVGLTDMHIADVGGTSGWVAYAPTRNWTLGGSDGTRTVTVQYRDGIGNVSAQATDTIVLDTTPPTTTMTALPTTSPAAVVLAWSGSDSTSGIASYDVQVREGTNGAWTDMLVGTLQTSTTYAGDSGTTYAFRVRAHDKAGNTEAWPTSPDTTTLVDTEPPTGTITINGGARASTSTAVSLALAAQDRLGTVTAMQVSNDGVTWTDWQSMTTRLDWMLAAGDGDKTVFARFKDEAGTISAVTQQTITLDTAAGNEYGLSVNGGRLYTNQTSVTLTIGAKPRTAQMQVSNDGGFAGVSWELYTSRSPWAITSYGSYVIPRVVYVRYKDIDGNISSTFQDDIILDVTPPRGTVTIRRTDTATTLAAVNVILELSAEDDVSGVGTMQVSNRADFAGADWQPYATTLDWTLDATEIVYVRYQDNAGNISAPAAGSTSGPVVVDTVTTIDTTTGGTIDATNGSGALAVSVDIPAGAVQQTTTISYSAKADAPTTTPGSGYRFAGQSFTLTAQQNGRWLSSFTFATPISITLAYDDTGMTEDEERALRLFYYDEATGTWQEAASYPSGYRYAPAANRVTVLVNHLTWFALFAQQADSAKQLVYLPLIMR